MNYFCRRCKKSIIEEVFKYSKEHFQVPLCRGHQPTLDERKLYEQLKKAGVPAKLNLFDGHKHIDIAVPEAHVNLEVDGPQHNFDHRQALKDLKRTFFSFRKGYLTLRIPNSLVRNNLKETVAYIVDFLDENLEQMEKDNDS